MTAFLGFNEQNSNRLEHHLTRAESKKGQSKLKASIDLKQVYALGKCLLPPATIAVNLGISRSLFDKWMNDWPEFAMALAEGQELTKRELSSVQLQLALSGNATMLIWLGKQHLQQADKQETKQTTINITVQKAMEELRNIPRDQLLEAQALLEAPVLDNAPAGDRTPEGVAPPANEPESHE